MRNKKSGMTTLSIWKDEIVICLDGESFGRSKSEEGRQGFNFEDVEFEMPRRHSCDDAK